MTGAVCGGCSDLSRCLLYVIGAGGCPSVPYCAPVQGLGVESSGLRASGADVSRQADDLLSSVKCRQLRSLSRCCLSRHLSGVIDDVLSVCHGPVTLHFSPASFRRRDQRRDRRSDRLTPPGGRPRARSGARASEGVTGPGQGPAPL